MYLLPKIPRKRPLSLAMCWSKLARKNINATSQIRPFSSIQKKDDLLSQKPAVWPNEVHDQIKQLLKKVNRKLVVLDDDPTGTQTVHSIPVLSTWDSSTLEKELSSSDGHCHTFYLLTNTRALNPAAAVERNSEIVANLTEAMKRSGEDVTIISRSDSTLRGHFPAEVKAIEDGMTSYQYDGWVVMPFFEEGGRLTIDDTHYVQTTDDGVLTPAGETQFAKDAAFGFKSSNLKEWVEEKTEGSVRAEDVVSVSLEDLRKGGPDAVTAKILAMPKGSICIVNAVAQRDLDVFVLGALQAELQGRTLLYRTAASFVAARGGITRKPALSSDELQSDDGSNPIGGLTVVGSYVSKTTEQLGQVLDTIDAETVELDVGTLAAGNEAESTQYIAQIANKTESLLQEKKDVILYTSRKIQQQDGEGGLIIGAKVNDALCKIVEDLECRPRYLVAKGGITSNDVAVRSLGITRAMVKGQILPGVPVWSCGQDSKYPGMNYIVFPGNVGGQTALSEALLKLGARPKTGFSKKHDSTTSIRRAIKSPEESVTMKILRKAQSEHYAIGAFNIYNIEGIKAVVDAAELLQASAILQVHPSSLKFSGPALLAACKAAASASKVPIAVHLDHADEEEAIRCALDCGVDSIMADGSGLEYEENIAWTAKMVALAHQKGVSVEAELGKLAGEEDGLSVPEKEAKMTDPEQVPDFVAKTGVNCMAVTIGNVHGKYKLPPNLDFDRLKEIRSKIEMPLVLHGASGLPDAMIHESISHGICKFNVNTEVRGAYIETMKNIWRTDQQADILDVMTDTKNSMQNVIESKMTLFSFTKSG